MPTKWSVLGSRAPTKWAPGVAAFGRRTALWALAAGVVALAGCQSSQVARNMERAEMPPAGHGVHLFGPTALAAGEEDRGHFARPAPAEEPLLMFDRRFVYVRTRIWDLEDNRRHGISHHRKWVWTEEMSTSLR